MRGEGRTTSTAIALMCGYSRMGARDNVDSACDQEMRRSWGARHFLSDLLILQKHTTKTHMQSQELETRVALDSEVMQLEPPLLTCVYAGLWPMSVQVAHPLGHVLAYVGKERSYTLAVARPASATAKSIVDGSLLSQTWVRADRISSQSIE